MFTFEPTLSQLNPLTFSYELNFAACYSVASC